MVELPTQGFASMSVRDVNIVIKDEESLRDLGDRLDTVLVDADEWKRLEALAQPKEDAEYESVE